jgi:hypothetical protein
MPQIATYERLERVADAEPPIMMVKSRSEALDGTLRASYSLHRFSLGRQGARDPRDKLQLRID